MGSLDEDPVFELVDAAEEVDEDDAERQDALAELDAQDGSDRKE